MPGTLNSRGMFKLAREQNIDYLAYKTVSCPVSTRKCD